MGDYSGFGPHFYVVGWFATLTVLHLARKLTGHISDARISQIGAWSIVSMLVCAMVGLGVLQLSLSDEAYSTVWGYRFDVIAAGAAVGGMLGAVLPILTGGISSS